MQFELAVLVFRDVESGFYVAHCPAVSSTSYVDPNAAEAVKQLTWIGAQNLKQAIQRGNLSGFLRSCGWSLAKEPIPPMYSQQALHWLCREWLPEHVLTDVILADLDVPYLAIDEGL